jgi:hypothetical protein
MVDQALEFIIVGVAEGEQYSVIGRCGDTPIHVGDVFDAVFRYKRRRRPDELGDEPVREVEELAAIRVVGIHAYQSCLSTLGEGMTGSLTLEGDGLQYLAPGWILGRKIGSPSTGEQKIRTALASATSMASD